MNKRELLIIVYKISVAGLTRAQAEDYLHRTYETFALRDDEELKENYIIREIFIPLADGDGQTSVEVIYPKPVYNISPTIDDLVDEISARIENNPDTMFKQQWQKLLRELKLRNLNLDYE